MAKNNLNCLLINKSNSELNQIKRNGFIFPGHNGPYNHPETPVRNTCHWLITFLKVYEITKEEKYLKAAKKAVEYLSKQVKKSKYNLHQRTVKNRDRCNGLIGPAWVMEALLIASKQLKRNDLAKMAEKIFLIHKFDEDRGLWHKREVDGKNLGIDWTFNHQLWFAAIASSFDRKQFPEIHRQISIFNQKMADNLAIYPDGLINHHVVKETLLKKLKRNFFKKHIIRQKAIGYHQFNLYAFALLKKNYPDLQFWKSSKWQKALKFIESDSFKLGLENNPYGFGYNLAGIETAYVLQTFKPNSLRRQQEWLEQQFNRNHLIDDDKTHSARIYEATRLNNLKINLITKKDLPFVSVVVPVFNNPKEIKKCIRCLMKQTYPKSKYEIIVVDNNSQDNTSAVIKEFPVKLLSETSNQSSYAARNTGIMAAKGEILALTDADCQPAKDWLENGVRALLAQKCYLVAGKVSFLYTNLSDPFEIYDSVSNMQQDEKIRLNRGAATANLIVSKRVFEKIGLFDKTLKSGGDIIWSLKAVKAGFPILYEPTVVVFHPTRNKQELLEKQKRVGFGQMPILKSKKRGYIFLILMMIKKLLPPISLPINNLKQVQFKLSLGSLIKIYLAKWLCTIYTDIGIFLYWRDKIRHEKV